MTYKTTGKSLLQLREEFGIGISGFCNSYWLSKEDFAKEKPPKGEWDIEFHPEWNNMTYQEQLDKMGNELELLHPAVLVEIILTHYKKTGERLMETWYSRTTSLDSGGGRVDVGGFDECGLHIYARLYFSYYRDDSRSGVIGLVASRKSLKTGSIDTLENRIIELENFKIKVEKILKI